MSEIRLARPHRLPLSRARAAVQGAAAQLGQDFGVTWHWEGDTLHLRRAGVEGRIEISPTQIALELHLGLLLLGLRSRIRDQLGAWLDSVTATATATEAAAPPVAPAGENAPGLPGPETAADQAAGAVEAGNGVAQAAPVSESTRAM
jgi:putative polyhydroxyalkanoate system protein